MRDWWKTGSKWFLFICALYVGSQFVPYSIGGPALSCFTSTLFLDAPPNVEPYSQRVGGDFTKVDAFLHRSDFEIARFYIEGKITSTEKLPDDTVTFVYRKDRNNASCYLLDLVAYEPTMLSVTVRGLESGSFNKIFDMR